MLPLLNSQSSVPLFDQIYTFFKQSIIDGTLVKGSKLTSIRKLSKSLEVSNNTVIAAYQQLIDEGYLINLPRKGIFVADLEPQEIYPVTRSPQINLAQPNSSIPLFEEKPRTTYAYNLNQAAIDQESFPMKDWRKCVNWALDNPCLQYSYNFV